SLNPKSNSSTVTVVDCGLVQGLAAGDGFAAPGFDTGVGLEDAAAVAATFTPIPIRPFMPAPACPGTLQRNSYEPVFLKVTVSVALLPVFNRFVTLPVHVSKSWLLGTA